MVVNAHPAVVVVVVVNAHLEGVAVVNAHLEGVVVANAHLEGVVVANAHLEGVVAANAHLEGVVAAAPVTSFAAAPPRPTGLPSGPITTKATKRSPARLTTSFTTLPALICRLALTSTTPRK